MLQDYKIFFLIRYQSGRKTSPKVVLHVFFKHPAKLVKMHYEDVCWGRERHSAKLKLLITYTSATTDFFDSQTMTFPFAHPDTRK